MQSNAQTAPPAVHSVDEFVFSVPDLEQARHFYSNFGLDVRDEGEYLALYTDGHPQRWARIRQGERKRLLWISMGIHAEDAERFAAHLDGMGVARIAAPPGADPAGLWIEAPDGLALQLRAAPKSSPSAPAPQTPPQPM
ncbi:metapyrocatechase, partial [Achromobacter anxifer]|nr:metapyrocatechase [Achromobacter anxifer]